MSFRKLALATTVTTLAVITVGGLVRATGSGDGCPDWPRCFGRWIPPLEYHALIEYSHRTVGAIAIGLLCATAVVALRRHREDRRLLVPTLLATSTIFMQAILGAIVVSVKSDPSLRHLEGGLVTFHIATAMLLIAMLVAVTVRAWRLEQPGLTTADPRLARSARNAAAAVFVLILIGAYVRGEHAGLAFLDWPLMNGALVPAVSGLPGLQVLHRLAAVVVGVVVAIFVVRARRAADRPVALLAVAAGVAYAAQAVVGGLQVLTRLAAPPVVAHVALSATIWALLVAVAALTGRAPATAGARAQVRRAARPDPAPVSGGQVGGPAQVAALPIAASRAGLGAAVVAYVQLTKPRIILLLLITTLPAMMLASGGMPSPWLALATLAGGTLAAGSANTINCYIDRDIDSVMRRTRSRPIPSHRIEPARALAFGLVLQVVSFVFMVATVNVPAALLAQAAILFYVFVYTIGLKRSTPQNIVIGGAAGAVPCLVGWAAVTGGLSWEPVILFGIVFLWTPPHFWALAMRYSADYASAGIPMLPVVKGVPATLRQIVAYTAATVGLSLVLWPAGDMGLVYGLAAIALGTWFMLGALALRRDPTSDRAMTLFKTSITYLALLFAAVALDSVARIAT